MPKQGAGPVSSFSGSSGRPPATLYATNDPAEAMTMADRVAVLNQGAIVQVGVPLDVYSRPSDVFVGRFFGLMPMNILPAVIDGDWRDPHLRLGGDRLALGRQAPVAIGAPVLLGIRPEHLTVAVPGTAFDRCLHGTVELVEPTGPHDLVRVRPGGGHYGGPSPTPPLPWAAPSS